MTEVEVWLRKLERIEQEAGYARAAILAKDAEAFVKHAGNLLSFAQFLLPGPRAHAPLASDAKR